MSSESPELPEPELDDLERPAYDTPPPEGDGPAASEEDFEPEDPDIEAIVDET